MKFLPVKVARRVGSELLVKALLGKGQRPCLFVLSEFHYRERVVRQSGTSSDHEHNLCLFASISCVRRYNVRTTEFVGPDRGERATKKGCATPWSR